MAVDSYTYGTVAGVHRRVGWVVPGRASFGAGTTPTEAQVEEVLDAIAAEIHAEMFTTGYQVDTKATLTTNAPRAIKWLTDLNEVGASVRVLSMFPVAGDPETDENNPLSLYRTLYRNGMKLIKGVYLQRAGLTRDHEQGEHLVCTSATDEDGNEKKPMFYRDIWSDPQDQPDEEYS